MSHYRSGFFGFSVSLACLALLLTVGCVGGRSQSALPVAPENTGIPQDGGFNLPSPTSLKVSALSTDSSNFKAASEYDDSLPSQRIETLRNYLLFNPHEAEDSLAYAMFSFPNVDPTWVPQIELGLQSYIREHRHHLFLGLANYETGSWNWFPLESNIVDFAGYASFISENGGFLAVVVSTAPIQIRMDWVRLGTSEWVVEAIDVGTAYPGHIAAAMDSNDKPRFCFNGEYGYLTDEGWVVEDTGSGMNAVHQLILDENDKPHICGFDGIDWGVGYYGYATRSSIYWERKWSELNFIPTNRITTHFISMDLDSNNLPHFAYFIEQVSAQPVHDLYYSGPVGDGTWTRELVDSEGETGHQCEIELDASDNPLIAYHGNNHQEGRIAYLDEGVWQTEVVSVANSTGVDLCYLSDDSPLLVFEGENLILQNLTDEWSYDNLGESSENGCLMLLKQDDTPLILHQPFSDFTLQMKSWKTGKWSDQWVDLPDEHEFPIYPDNDGFMLDSNNKPHLIYCAKINGTNLLFYAHLE